MGMQPLSPGYAYVSDATCWERLQYYALNYGLSV